MATSDITGSLLVAPCGINCRLCRAYQRDRNPCPGCRGEDTFKPVTRLRCRIKNCEKITSGKLEFCSECGDFPCKDLLHLDTRYRTRYGTSPVGNLVSIREIGILEFEAEENRKWTCSGCGALLCMHEAQCPACGHSWRD